MLCDWWLQTRMPAWAQVVRCLSLSRGVWFIMLVSCVIAAHAAPPVWSRARTPTQGAPMAIGGPSNGCLAGALPLEESGTGFVSLRRQRHRFFAHPKTLAFVRELGRVVAETEGRFLMVGDLAQPRGGLMDSLHRSHQNGMDVDLWFRLAESPEQAWATAPEGRNPPSMVAADGRALSGAWGPAQRTLLHRVATHPDVERIFVNPAIKQALCEQESDPAWLRKLRPWSGHDAHFHVRLRCPSDSPLCENQAPLPAGSGCDASLAWWFSAEARAPRAATGKAQQRPPPPAACMAIADAP